MMLMMQQTYINAQSNYMILVEQALMAVEHDSLLHAEKLYKQALDAEPTNYTNTLIFTNLIRLQESQMKFTDAIETCNQALEQFPNSEVFLSMRGNIFFRMKQYARALQDYEQVLSRHPGEYKAMLGKCRTRMEMGQVDEAYNLINILVTAYPESAYLYFMRAEIESRTSRPELARIDIDKAIELEPSNDDYKKWKQTFLLKEK